jgi:O-antigen/teichoic acid export membrane protein
MFAPVLLSTAWLPRMISAFEESPERLLKTARRPVEFAILVSVPICAGTAVVAGYLVPILYGSSFDNAVPVMIILGLCLPPMYANIMLASVLLAANRQMAWTWVMVGAAIFNPLVNLLLIPWTQHHYGNGAIGAALSLLLTELIMVAYGFKMVGRRLLDATLVRRSTGVIAASVGMWAVAYATRPLGPAVSIGAGCLTFAILVFALRVVGRDEIELARGLIARRRAA